MLVELDFHLWHMKMCRIRMADLKAQIRELKAELNKTKEVRDVL